MNLQQITVNDLPLSGYVSYSSDISNYVSNMLKDVSYSNENIMTMPLSSVISAMSDCISQIVQKFGGNTTVSKDQNSNAYVQLEEENEQYLMKISELMFENAMLTQQLHK